MGNKKMKTVLVDVVKDKLIETEIEDDLDAFYKALDVDMIELPQRKIGGKWYTIMCDEEGLLKSNPIVAAADPSGEDIICGNIMVFNDTGIGELEGLSEEDVNRIKGCVRNVVDIRHPKGIHKIILLG